jgi:hypothetical protein
VATRNLGDAHPDLIEAFTRVRLRFEEAFPGWTLRPTAVYRSPDEQFEAFKAGRSQIDGYKKKGKHNHKPSRAIDAGIFTPKGEYLDTLLASGRVQRELHTAMYWCFGQLAQSEGLRWGNDWDSDRRLVGPDPDE